MGSDLSRWNRRPMILVLEGATMVFRNFKGVEGRYNREGDRNFCVLLDDQTAEAMIRDGWNVKSLKSREGTDEPPQPYLMVAVGFKVRPPRMVLITHKGKTEVPEDLCEFFDQVDIRNVDLTIAGSEWAVNGNSGVKAYLRTMYLTVEEDPLDIKYADVKLEELPTSSGRTNDNTIEGELVRQDQYELEG